MLGAADSWRNWKIRNFRNYLNLDSFENRKFQNYLNLDSFELKITEII